jgi:hypothetical protein
LSKTRSRRRSSGQSWRRSLKAHRSPRRACGTDAILIVDGRPCAAWAGHPRDASRAFQPRRNVDHRSRPTPSSTGIVQMRIACSSAATPACPLAKQPTRTYDELMIRMVGLGVAFVLAISGYALGAKMAAFNPCPRPSDQYGPRFEIMTGSYRSRGVSPGGGKFVTIMGKDMAAPVSVNVTDDVFAAAGTLAVGTSISLLAYPSNPMSGSQPPYSCIELAH